MFEWCSISVISTASPGLRLVRAQEYATRLIASVTLRVKIVERSGALVNAAIRLRAQRVDAAMDVRVVVAVVVVERRQHLLGLLRSRGGVEVDETVAVDLPRKDREVGADVELGRRDCCCVRGARHGYLASA
jgi:hypothetical protein